jgi:hypothetical protein
MANNCLITKLKTEIDNFNLPYLDEIRFHFTKSSDNTGYKVKIYVKENATILTDDNHTFTVEGQSYREYTVQGLQHVTFEGQNDTYDVIVRSKDVLENIAVDNSEYHATKHWTFDISRLQYCSSFNTLSIVGVSFSEELKVLPTSAYNFDITRTDLQCDLDQLDLNGVNNQMIRFIIDSDSNCKGNIVNLATVLATTENTTINFTSTNVYGDIEEFAEALVNAGHTSYAVTVWYGGSKITVPDEFKTVSVLEIVFSPSYEKGYILQK